MIEAVPAWSGHSIDVRALDGGITNRNFRVDVDGESFVVRLAGSDTHLLGIDREAERRAAQAAAAVGVAPEVVAFLPRQEALITRFIEADPLLPRELERREVLSAVVASVRSIHGMAEIPSTFDAFRVVRQYRATAERRGVSIPDAYARALRAAERIREALDARPQPVRPCHDDLLNANFLVRGGRVFVVDYEYAGMGDPFFDLGNLSINNDITENAQEMLLELYFGRVTRAARARLQLMRVMSDFREAMWGVVQQGISTLGFDFVGYADRHFERCLHNAADDRFGGWLTDATGET